MKDMFLKLWNTEWALVKVNQRLLLVLVALFGLYKLYSFGYNRGAEDMYQYIMTFLNQPEEPKQDFN